MPKRPGVGMSLCVKYDGDACIHLTVTLAHAQTDRQTHIMKQRQIIVIIVSHSIHVPVSSGLDILSFGYQTTDESQTEILSLPPPRPVLPNTVELANWFVFHAKPVDNVY